MYISENSLDTVLYILSSYQCCMMNLKGKESRSFMFCEFYSFYCTTKGTSFVKMWAFYSKEMWQITHSLLRCHFYVLKQRRDKNTICFLFNKIVSEISCRNHTVVADIYLLSSKLPKQFSNTICSQHVAESH